KRELGAMHGAVIERHLKLTAAVSPAAVALPLEQVAVRAGAIRQRPLRGLESAEQCERDTVHGLGFDPLYRLEPMIAVEREPDRHLLAGADVGELGRGRER